MFLFRFGESDRDRRWWVRVPKERQLSVSEAEGPLNALYALRFTTFLRPGIELPQAAALDDPWLRLEIVAGQSTSVIAVGERLPHDPELRLARVDGEIGTVADAAAARIEHEISKLVRERGR